MLIFAQKDYIFLSKKKNILKSFFLKLRVQENKSKKRYTSFELIIFCSRIYKKNSVKYIAA